MITSIISDITKISKNVKNIEKILHDICGGEVIRWAIVEVGKDFYKVSFSYKK